MESLDEGAEGDGEADDAEEHPQEDDETVVGDGTPVQSRSFQFKMEVAGPDERQHGTRETADQAHENGEMWDPDGHDDGEGDHSNADSKSPHFQLAIQCPHGGKRRLRPPFE